MKFRCSYIGERMIINIENKSEDNNREIFVSGRNSNNTKLV